MTRHFTDEQWRSLPLDIRQRWWDETDYGKNAPSDELKRQIESVIGVKVGE